MLDIESVQPLNFSGEPLIPEKQSGRHKDGPIPPISVLEYQDLALRRKTYCESYADYWELTKASTRTGEWSDPHGMIPKFPSMVLWLSRITGRPVDAIISPVAPHVAVIPGKYYHYGLQCLTPFARVSTKSTTGYTEVFNVLDYSCVTIPVTRADKTSDNPEIYHGAPVGLRIVG
jgi:amidase